jgi:hypothetical protein
MTFAETAVHRAALNQRDGGLFSRQRFPPLFIDLPLFRNAPDACVSHVWPAGSLRKRTVQLPRGVKCRRPRTSVARNFFLVADINSIATLWSSYALYATDPAFLFDAAEIVDLHRLDRTYDYRAVSGLQPSHTAASAHRLPDSAYRLARPRGRGSDPRYLNGSGHASFDGGMARQRRALMRSWVLPRDDGSGAAALH